MTFDAGYAHACVLKNDGTLVCWGDVSFGQASPPWGSYTQVSAGRYHTCAVRDGGDGTAGGTLACWGRDILGQATPPAGMTLSSLAAGYSHTCGLRQGDRIEVCWGRSARNLWR